MSDFPELQNALVDAARRRHGRAPRTWRLVRPVAVAAAVAAAAAGVLIVAGNPADDRGVNPPAAAGLTPLEQDFAVFRRPQTAVDELPDVKAVEQGWRLGDTTLTPETSRLVVDDEHWKVYLSAARWLDGPAVCAIAFYDGRLRAPHSCAVKLPPGMIDPGLALANRWLLGENSWPPNTTTPGALMTVVPDGADDLTYTYADGSEERPPVANNLALVTPIERWPTRLSYSSEGERMSEPMESLERFRRTRDIRPGFGE
jgi:hypothetical protein